MKRLKDVYIINIIFSLIAIISVFQIVRVDNESRVIQNINTDYYMNSLPYIYILLVILGVLLIFNIYKLGMVGGEYNFIKKESSK